jgi:hypothetical protein
MSTADTVTDCPALAAETLRDCAIAGRNPATIKTSVPTARVPRVSVITDIKPYVWSVAGFLSSIYEPLAL